MAKYSLPDSASRTVANHYHPFRAISLSFLLLLISLISISCASFGQQHQFKRHQNSYSTLSDSDDNTNLDSSLGQWAPSPVSHVSYKALPLESAAAGSNYEPPGRQQQQQQQHSGSSYGVSPSLAEDRQKFYNQIRLLADNNNYNNYYDNQNDENVIVRPETVFENRPNNADRSENERTIQYQIINNNDYNQLAPLRDSEIYYSSPPFVPTSNDDNNNINDVDAIARAKLLELLSANRNGGNDHQLSEDYQYLLEPNSKPQHISIYQNLDHDGADKTPLAKGQQQEEINKNFAYQVGQQQQQQPQSQQIRTTDETEKRSGSQTDDKIEVGKGNITLTTLLEDEDENVDAKYTTEASSESNSNSNNNNDKETKTTSGEIVRNHKTEQAPYIRVMTEGKNHKSISTNDDDDDGDAKSSSTTKSIIQATTSKIGSLFSGIYNLVSSHLPNLWSTSKQDKPFVVTATTTTLPSRKAEQRQRITVDDNDHDDDDDNYRQRKTTPSTATTGSFTKPSVSEPASKLDIIAKTKDDDEVDKNSIMINDISSNNNSRKIQDDERNKWSIDEENDDKQTLVPISQTATNTQQQRQTTTFNKQQDNDSNDNVGNTIMDEPVKVQSSADRKVEDRNQEESSLSSLLPFESSKRIEIRPHIGGIHKISLLRQPTNLMMPFKSSDELIVEPADQQANSLFGKYIYAPEHHYHLSTLSSFADSIKQPVSVATAATSATASVNDANDDIDSIADANDDDVQMFTKMSSRSARQNIHAGDNVYAGTFSGLRPFYAASHLATTTGDRNDRLSLLSANNKSNDIYFLVMVAAFCCMAMAVVLVAGLFAYRVQQQRKSTSEADYPTYGVVGPNNNMIGNGAGGKCGGAASFVGGYFTGVGGPGSSSSGSKSGSVKQLADMYSIGADSGISGSGAKSSPAGGKRVVLSSDHNNGSSNTALSGGTNNNNNNNNHNNGQARFANQNAARMFHYQNQKQQMIISDRSSNGRHTSASDLDSEDENDENSYTVYECPGLASAHEMEIKNPLFNDDQTP